MSWRGVLIGATALPAACSSSTLPAPLVHQFVVRYESGSPKFAAFTIGTRTHVIGEAFDDAGQLVPVRSIEYVSRNPAVMEVDAQGLVTAKAVGETSIVGAIQTATGVQRDSVRAAVGTSAQVTHP